MYQDCACAHAVLVPTEPSIEVLAAIRSQCGALQRVFLPDELWAQFESWHKNPDSIALHRSVLLLALERGHLGAVTSPIHRYLLENGSVRPEARQQYLKDLRERWMYYTSPVERHTKSRIFRGRIAELQCAEWLETREWVITGLEALREGPDIEATAPDASSAAFEVKFIGTEDNDFDMIVRSIAGEPAGGSVSAYAPINYLLFRVYEAAKQLGQVTRRRIAVVIIEDLTWWRFELQLQNNWLDWNHPKFLAAETDWEEFLKQQNRYPALLSELASVVAGLDAVWIVSQSSAFQFELKYQVSTPSA